MTTHNQGTLAVRLSAGVVVVLLTLGWLLAACRERTDAEMYLTIDASTTYQTMEGFGASAAWWAQDVGGWEGTREEIADLLFDPQKGIGLTIIRYNIGAGAGENIQDAWRRTETFEVAPGEYDWSRDANALWMIKAAQARGVEQIVAFANSPPARMTVSGLTTGEQDGKSNLRPEMVDDFAQYLVDVVRYLREDEGLPVDWISPINEPQWDWNYENGQEGCHYSPEEIVDVTRALLAAIERERLNVRVSTPESGEWKNSQVYLDALMREPEIAAGLEHFAVHSYWSERNDKERFAQYADKYHPGLKLWMSEWTEMKRDRDVTMDSALVLANTVQEDLTVGGATSWQYWIAVSKYFFRDGLIYVSTRTQELEVTRRLWALGNFSRFVRPGYVRIEAGIPADAALRPVAFRAPDGEELVVVVVNNAAEPRTVGLTLDGADADQLEAFETSEAHALTSIYAGKVPREIILSAQSVTTLILR